jgi:ADP-ribose pyrophosphatase
MSIKILKEENILEGFLKVVKALVEQTLPNGDKITYNRSKVERENAVGIIVENEETGKLIFVRQHRYPIGEKTDPMILEIVAGRIEGNDDPIDTAIREMEEEIGYKIDKNKIRFLNSYFTSPGYSSEQIFLYHAWVRNSDKVSKGGGLETENEFIVIEEYDYPDVEEMFRNREFKDGKTQIALLLWFAKMDWQGKYLPLDTKNV